MTRHIILYIATMLTMLPLDMLFLRVLAKDFFNRNIGHVLTDNPDLKAAALFYLLYPVGVVVFVSAGAQGWKETALYGALFGFMCYATFELTSKVVIKGWTWPAVLADVSWGTFVTAVAATVGYFAAKMFAR